MSKEAFDKIASGLKEALAVAKGEAEPAAEYVSGRDAADILNVSEGYLAKLLEEKKIHSLGSNGHPLVKLSDLMAFKTADDAMREKIRAELTVESQELGLGYGYADNNPREALDK